MNHTKQLLSIVVPAHNESNGLLSFHMELMSTLTNMGMQYEVIYCDDGSTDTSNEIIIQLCKKYASTRLVTLSRNFGKEAALAAGLAIAGGDAILMIDADGQHPVKNIPDFINEWKAGAQVVVGISKTYRRAGIIKRAGSGLFYKLFNSMSTNKLIPGSSDFRLIDKEVKNEFLRLHETNRITRGLIDWLGFKRVYIQYTTQPRIHGTATYSSRKLLSLATNSFVSLSTRPLYFFGYVGVAISTISLLLGIAVIVEQLLLNDPFKWRFTGTAMLGVLIIFLVGIVLMSQGILALYISHIHEQSKHRPLYVIDHSRSVRITS